jgi:type IV fimbrial biogenesis protein FimT
MDIASAFVMAKSEATKRMLPVYVTALGATSGNEFVGGWKVWVDTNGDGSQGSTEPTVRQHEAYKAPIVISTNDTSTSTSFTQVGFSSQGFLIGASKTLTICDGRTGVKGGRITLTPAGTVDLKEDYTC